MQVQVIGGSSLDLASDCFEKEFNKSLVHQAVTAYQAGGRAGTKAQKTRSEVSGGGAKPWRQKGTGRARAGTIRSPIWRSGGATFAAKPRNFEQKLNKKMYRAAMRSILSELLRQERLVVIDTFELADHKTKTLIAKLAEYEMSDALVVVEELTESLVYSSGNLPFVDVSDVGGLNPVSLLSNKKVLITSGAIAKVQEWLS